MFSVVAGFFNGPRSRKIKKSLSVRLVVEAGPESESGKRSMTNYWIFAPSHNIIFIKGPIFLVFYHTSFAIYVTNTFNPSH